MPTREATTPSFASSLWNPGKGGVEESRRLVSKTKNREDRGAHFSETGGLDNELAGLDLYERKPEARSGKIDGTRPELTRQSAIPRRRSSESGPACLSGPARIVIRKAGRKGVGQLPQSTTQPISLALSAFSFPGAGRAFASFDASSPCSRLRSKQRFVWRSLTWIGRNFSKTLGKMAWQLVECGHAIDSARDS